MVYVSSVGVSELIADVERMGGEISTTEAGELVFENALRPNPLSSIFLAREFLLGGQVQRVA